VPGRAAATGSNLWGILACHLSWPLDRTKSHLRFVYARGDGVYSGGLTELSRVRFGEMGSDSTYCRTVICVIYQKHVVSEGQPLAR
jgi:hypothetical protein